VTHGRRIRLQLVVGALAVLGSTVLAACSSTPSPPSAASKSAPTTTSTLTSTAVPPSSTPTVPSTTTTTTTTPPLTGGTRPAGQPLAGKIVGIDPGHNGQNYTDPSFLNQQVFNGRTEEDCDTTGTETDSGYTEAQFNFNVAQYLLTDLKAEGAQVVLTRTTNDGVGPCVDQRAQLINNAHADVAIDIHADGGPPDGRGFAILEPVADGPNDAVISSSEAFGSDVRSTFLAATGMPVSSYDGTNGVVARNDLAGLNLATEPKVLIECGNMRNAADATLLTSTSFQQNVARILAIAITDFLR
jgi:N-acetylmuramoyl-L-alanine amidase